MRINEAFGVPEGITKEARRIYTEIIQKIDSLDIKDTTVVIGKWDIKFADLELREIPIILRITLDENLNDYSWLQSTFLTGAAYGNESEWVGIGDRLSLKQNIPKSFIIIEITSKELDPQKIKDCLRYELKSPLIAHEIHHLYEASKARKRSLKSLVNYKSYQISNFPPIIADFLHLLYYVTTIENFVRPSEMLMKMEEEGVTKVDFSRWIKGTNMMKDIEKARTFSMEEFLQKASEDPLVKKMLKQSKESGFQSTGSDIRDIMKIIFINISNIGSEVGAGFINNYFDNIRSKSILQSLLGIESPSIKKAREICDREFNNIIKFYSKWEGKEEKYFDFLQKRINFAGEKMKKKLSKLWSMLNESNQNSILNWDLWTKMVSGDKPLKTTIDFKKLKNDFNNQLGS